MKRYWFLTSCSLKGMYIKRSRHRTVRKVNFSSQLPLSKIHVVASEKLQPASILNGRHSRSFTSVPSLHLHGGANMALGVKLIFRENHKFEFQFVKKSFKCHHQIIPSREQSIYYNASSAFQHTLPSFSKQQ